MRKRIIALILAVVLVLMIVVCRLRKPVYADPFGIMELSGITYAMQSAFGLSFFPDNATASGIKNIMANQLQDYINSKGGSITSLFGIEAAKLVAGKIVVAYTMVNGVIDFTNWLIEKFGLEEAAALISRGFIGDIEIDEQKEFDESGTISQVGYDLSFSGSPPYAQYGRIGYNLATIYLDGESITTVAAGTSRYYTGQWYIGDGANESYWYICIPYWVVANSYHPERDYLVVPGNTYSIGLKTGFELTNIMEVSMDSGAEIPDAIDPGWVWEGDLQGWTGPDTNIDDFYDEVIDDILAGDIDIEGEIVEDQPIPPEPTPIPIDPDTPLSDVPWEGLGPDIGDIAGHTGEIAESVEGIGDSVETIEQTLTDALNIPTEAEAAEAKFDLSLLFPFCIPFDIYRMLQQFNSDPVAPHVQIPFVIESLGFEYMIDLDFASWSPVAAALRAVEFVLYGITLAWATSKVIKW